MNRRTVFLGILGMACVAVVVEIGGQHREIVSLRARQNQLLEQISNAPKGTPSEVSLAQSAPSRPPLELLELRNKVTQLSQRKQELEGARGENEHLRSQLAARTNSAGQPVLPAGYIRKSQAQWVGLTTPENTIQSFLWAIQNRDLPHLMQTLTPRQAEQIMRGVTNAPEQVFDHGVGVIPGIRLVNKQSLPDGSIRAQMEAIPGQPLGWFRFEQINGEWKMDF